MDHQPPRVHPVLACADAIEQALKDVSGVDPGFMVTEEKAAALTRLDRLADQVTALRLRVMAGAGDVADVTADHTVATWLAAETRTGRTRAESYTTTTEGSCSTGSCWSCLPGPEARAWPAIGSSPCAAWNTRGPPHPSRGASSRPVKPGVPRPASRATTTAWARSRRASLAKMWRTWVLTVAMLMNELLGDLGVGAAGADQGEDLALPFAEVVEAGRLSGAATGGRAEKWSIIRASTAGATPARPPQPGVRRRRSPSAVTSLSRKPTAPARSTSTTCWSRSKVVSAMTAASAAPRCGGWPRPRRRRASGGP